MAFFPALREPLHGNEEGRAVLAARGDANSGLAHDLFLRFPHSIMSSLLQFFFFSPLSGFSSPFFALERQSLAN